MHARQRNLVLLCRQISSATAALSQSFRICLAIGLASVLTLTAADARCQEALPTQQATPAAKPPTQKVTRSSNISAQDQERIMAEVREIMAIRQQMGGGVAEQLGDLQLNLNPVDAAKLPNAKSKPSQIPLSEKFAQELKQQAIQSAKRQGSKSAAANTAASPSEIQPLIPAPKTGTLAENPLDDVQILHLRKSAKMLEEAAANLEIARQYDQADKIRALAGEIWRSAR